MKEDQMKKNYLNWLSKLLMKSELRTLLPHDFVRPYKSNRPLFILYQ